MSKPGVVLFAHGARDPKWSEPFESLARRFAALAPDVPVSLAYLDFMSPDLPGAVRALAARGCDAITIVPAFLGVGGHVRQDVPAIVEAIAREHPHVTLRVASALGEDASVQEAMARASVAAAKA
ncbi:MAG: CbiX/SirB N-terminal domain-containing protein [Burkholderiales bacterium]